MLDGLESEVPKEPDLATEDGDISDLDLVAKYIKAKCPPSTAVTDFLNTARRFMD